LVLHQFHCDFSLSLGESGFQIFPNGWSERQWRHLDTCQFETVIQARIPQLKYSDGTVEELTVPWAERYSRVPVLPSFHDRLSNR